MNLLLTKEPVNCGLFIIVLLLLSMKLTAAEKVAQENIEQSSIEQQKYKIAYNVLTDPENDNYEIFIMDLNGQNKRNISHHKAVDWVYYAFKDKLYFLSDRDTKRREFYLYSMNTNGDQVKKISDIRLKDSWFGSRNDASEFVINPHGTERPTFYIISEKGEHLQTVHPKLKFASDPIFTADGQHIIFRGANHANKKEPGFIDEIYICDLEGNILKQLTHYPKSDTTSKWYDYKAGVPKLNVKQDFISYQSFQNGKYSLFATNLEDNKQWKLTSLIENEGWHSWSPDSEWLAIELFDTAQTQFNIGLLNWQTKEIKMLTNAQFKYQQAPVFVLAR